MWFEFPTAAGHQDADHVSTEYEKPSTIVVRIDGAIAVERMNEKNAERTAGEPEPEQRGDEGLTGRGRAASARRVAPRVCL